MCTVYETIPPRSIGQKKFAFFHIRNMMGNVQMLPEVLGFLKAYGTIFFILFKYNNVMSREAILFREDLKRLYYKIGRLN